MAEPNEPNEPTDAAGSAGVIEEMLRNYARAQERSLGATTDWSASIVGAVTEQATSYTALLRSVQSSLTAMEQALESQAATNRALKESLDAAREVITSASAAQERQVRLANELLAQTLGTFESQLEALRSQVQSGARLLTGPAAGQSEAFRRMADDWISAYSRLLDTSLSSLRRGRGTGSDSGAGPSS